MKSPACIERKNHIYGFFSVLLTMLTLWLMWPNYVPEEKITLSFYQETTDPVHFYCWYKTTEQEEFAKERLIYEKKAPHKGIVSFDIPAKHLHTFRLDFLPVSDTDILLRDIRIHAGEKEHRIEDLSSLTFAIPKDAGLKIQSNEISWRCSRPVGKITPKKPVNISLPLNINWSLLLLSAWASLSGWYVVLSLLNRLYKKRKQIADAYTYRATSAQTGRFESHLEGLRGLAILLVLVFHLGTTGVRSPITLNGGFLGVEMFLVLSGYLLLLGFCRKHEGPLTFIRKKLLRIMLPVSVLILLTMACCLWCMDFEDLVNMAQNAWYALLGCVNIHLSADGAEYFSSDQAFNPLLHMWYVAITLQLYLVLYIGYLLIWPLPKWLKIFILAVFAGISYTWGNCHALRADVVASLDLPLWMTSEGTMYYSTFARLWEAILGMGILLLPVSRNKVLSSVLSSMAIVGIVLCVWLLPPHAMLLTASATALLIRYGNAGFVSGILNHKYIRFIGKISFSIYLVHMPLFVCYKCSTFSSLSYPEAILLLLVSIALGWCFWWLVEKRQIPAWGFLGIWLCAMGIAQLLIQTNGLKEYWNKESNAYVYPSYPDCKEETDSKSYIGFDKNKLKYEYGWIRLTGETKEGWKEHKYMLRLGVTDQKPTFVLIGDSHAQHYIMGIDVLCKKNNKAGIYLGSIMVPFWDREEPEASKHYYFNREKAHAFVKWLKSQPSITHVVIAQTASRFLTLHLNWDKQELPKTLESNAPAFREFCLQMKKAGKEAIMFAPLPLFGEKSPIRYYRFLKRTGQTAADSPYPETIVTEKMFNATFSDTISFLQELDKEGVCRVLYPHHFLFHNGKYSQEKDGILLYKDKNHFTVTGSIMAIESVSQEFLQALSKREKKQD